MPRRRRLPVPGALVSSRRPTSRLCARDLEEAQRLLALAQREGRFGASALYEERLEVLGSVSTRAELDALVGDLADLVPEPSRQIALAVLRRAHAEGRISLGEFAARTDRCLMPLGVSDVEALVSDLDYRVARPRTRPRRRAPASLVVVPVVAGIALGGLVVAAPAALGVGVTQWVPLAAAVGAFTTVSTVVVHVAWRIRAPVGRRVRAPGRDHFSPRRDDAEPLS